MTSLLVAGVLRSSLLLVVTVLWTGGCDATLPPAASVPARYAGEVASDDVARGKWYYSQNCSGFRCHGGLAPTLTELRAAPGQVRVRVREGGRRMPAFDRSVLGDDALEDILAYLAAAGAIRPTSGAAAR